MLSLLLLLLLFDTDFLTSYVDSAPPGSRHWDEVRSTRNLLRKMIMKEKKKEGAEVGRERLRVVQHEDNLHQSYWEL